MLGEKNGLWAGKQKSEEFRSSSELEWLLDAEVLDCSCIGERCLFWDVSYAAPDCQCRKQFGDFKE